MKNHITLLDDLLNQKIVSILSDLLDQKLSQINSDTSEKKLYLSVEETAKMLGIKPGTLYNLNLKRELPFHKVGKTLLYKRSDVLEYIDSHRVSSADEIRYQSQVVRPRRVRR